MPANLLGYARGLAGAVVGGAVGYGLFYWLGQSGFYAIILIGLGTGLGCGLAAGMKSLPLSIFCTLAAAGLSIFAEWKYFPFAADESFGYFLAHFHKLNPVHLLMLIGGAGCAFWFSWAPRSGPKA